MSFYGNESIKNFIGLLIELKHKLNIVKVTVTKNLKTHKKYRFFVELKVFCNEIK